MNSSSTLIEMLLNSHLICRSNCPDIDTNYISQEIKVLNALINKARFFGLCGGCIVLE